MSDHLPPRRTLPDDVRDRLRAEVRQGIAKRRPTRVWYAAAAAVVVLAVGAVVATQVIRQQPVAGPPPAPDPGNHLTLDAKVATSSLDRCWAAVRAAGKEDRVPPREEWVPLFTEVLGADSVVAVTAAGKPMFCETTATTVTLSDPGAAPAYAPGTHVGLLLHSATGVVAGVVDAGSAPPFLDSRTEGGDNMSQSIRPSTVTGQFVAMTRSALWTTTLSLENPPAPGGTVLPTPPPWLVMAVDRPVTAERTSPAGRALGECLNFAEIEVIPDAAAYAPGPLLEADGYQVVLGRHDGRVVVCAAQPDRQRPGKTKYRAYIDYTGPQTPPARTLPVDTLGGTESEAAQGKARRPYVAALPTTAVKATIDFGIGTSVEADVVDGMVATWVPQNVHLSLEAMVHVQARDAQGKVVYDGSLMQM
ncbi:hypothetical protein Amsp01_075080 [Amycolatopsis sp. NBRC 101858]|uniref:hypothetical protein n=1 Tax=Amycolatopsis sp. NBRC 101858 TaxID=3032200 RepID=UPI0024A5DF1A|nr:hypothetical protein [Amycolatopsis sp. NBRC 101858]GLY41485.1 hypothetical protein Amsp01_075080 [Amycolatopsis sp. NBRC 101858]